MRHGAEVFHVDADQVDPAAWDAAVHHGFFVVFDVAIGATFPGAVGGPAAEHPGPATVSGRTMRIESLQISTRAG